MMSIFVFWSYMTIHHAFFILEKRRGILVNSLLVFGNVMMLFHFNLPCGLVGLFLDFWLELMKGGHPCKFLFGC